MAVFDLSNAAGVGFNMSTTGNDGFAFVTADPGVFETLVFDDGATAIWEVHGSFLMDSYGVNYSTDGFNVTIFDALYFRGGTEILSVTGVNLHTTFDDMAAGSAFVRLNAQDDEFYGNDFNDVIRGGTGNDLIVGYLGNDTLLGDSGNDTIGGGGGNDLLIGGDGFDTVSFGGNSTNYSFARNSDGSITVTDSTGGWGVDVVDGFEQFDFDNGFISVAALPIAAYVPPPQPPAPTAKNISGSSASETIYGDVLNDTLKGNGGNDRVYGQGGNDKLYGGTGKDNLYGGAGKDIFVFNTKLSKFTNVDKITDFNVRDDSIWLDNAIFKKLGKGSEASPVKLNKAFFTVGSAAKDKNDYVIYDNKKGVLLYDADGNGTASAIVVTTLSKSLKMTYNDFFVV